MKLTVIKPNEAPAPIPEPTGVGSVLLLAGPAGAAKHIVFKVAAWDPSKHPKGAKGLFVETPDKIKATEAGPGDVLVTKNGKAFHVEKQTPKGVKVNPVDSVTGEVKGSYTVLGNDIEVGVVQAAKGTGTSHPVSEIAPGTYIRTKAGKRFKVSKHGKWTTVYPVDDDGEVSGKHTVLPPGTVVTVDAPSVAKENTPQLIAEADKIGQVVANEHKPTASPATVSEPDEQAHAGHVAYAALKQRFPEFGTAPELADGDAADLETLTQDLVGKTDDQMAEWLVAHGYFDAVAAESAADGWHLHPSIQEAVTAAEAQAQQKQVVQDGAQTVEQKVQEVLPAKLPKVPKPYPPGAGKGTRIVMQTGGAYVGVYREAPDGSRQHLRTFYASGITAARSVARSMAGDHEEIVERAIGFSAEARLGRHEEPQYLMDPNGHVVKVVSISDDKVQSHSDYTVRRAQVVGVTIGPDGKIVAGTQQKRVNLGSEVNGTWTGGSALAMTAEEVEKAAAQAKGDAGYSAHDGAPGAYESLQLGQRAAWDAMEQRGAMTRSDEVRRKARPERYSEYLQSDWSPEALVGATPNEALKALGKLGYREIRPRQKDSVRVINANGARLLLSRDGQKIVGITQPSAPALAIDGSARDAYEQLKETLATGGDVSAIGLDGPPEARTSLARGILHDLAAGKQAGVAEKIGKAAAGAKVKTDAEYLAELEAEGVVKPAEAHKADVERPDYTVTGASQLSAFDGQTGAVFGTPEDLTLGEATALAAILKRRGMAQQVLQSDEIEGDYSPALKASDPIEGARKLAAAAEAHAQGGPSALDQMDEGSRGYVLAQLAKFEPLSAQALAAREAEWLQRAENHRAQAVKDEVAKRRKAEGTIPGPAAGGAFDLPVWDEIEMEPQTFADINQLVATIGDTPHDVPAFYSGGVLRDAVVQHRADWSYGRVELQFDQRVKDVLQQQGAIEEDNRDPIDPGYNGSAKLYDGKQMTLIEQDGPDGDAEYKAAVDAATQGGVYAIWELPAEKQAELQAIQNKPKGQKRIEYVMHDQAAWNAGGAPTSQRGALRMVGYTPEEAAARLRELGLLGDLEPEVPFKALLRSTRRHGLVAPMHPAYLRGEADPPKVKARITHGITNTHGGGAVESLKKILGSGGLQSIAERHRQRMLQQTKGVSISGDIRSGIDHAVFCTFDSGGACGAGSQVKFVIKPSAYLRRDVTLAPSDFGGCDSRYSQYKSYLNKLQASAGVPKTNLYEPVDPRVRQLHVNGTSATSSVEYNIGPSITIEDMEAIGVPSQADADAINALLDSMLASGKIASKPQVLLNAEANKLGDTGAG